MSFSEVCASPFWFPDSILLCALLVTPPKRWWLFVLGPLPIRLFLGISSGSPQWFLLAAFAIDSVKGLVSATLLRRFIKNPVRLATLRDFAVFSLFAVLLVPFVAALGGAAIRHARGFPFWPSWEQWFIGNVLTHMVVTPAIFYLVLGAPWKTPKLPTRRWVEGVLLVTGLTVTTYIAFTASVGEASFAESRFYAPVPFMFWAAIRFGMFGASGATTIVAFLAVEAALTGRGPFTGQSPAETALSLQQFLLLRAAPLYLVAILIEQKRGDERSLRKSEGLNRDIVNSLTSLIVILDRSGRVIAANNPWTHPTPLCGVPTPESGACGDYLETCSCAARAGNSTCAEVLAGIDSVLAGRKSLFQREYRATTSGGTIWFEVTIVPLQSEAGGVVISQRNISIRRQAEAEVHQLRQELTHAGRVTMLGQLASSLAHELNQPLGSILRNAEAAEIFLQSENPDLDEVRAIVADIRKEDQRAAGVIDRLRALLKRREFDPVPVSLEELVAEVVALTRADSVTRHVSIRLELASGLPLVRGDRIHLQQVLLNLLLNGMDALDGAAEGKRLLAVSTRQSSPGFLEVSVRDSGSGIPPEKLSQLFQPFFTTKPAGMGLGLPISKTIIETHGGRLWAENNAEGGATFCFTLPIINGGTP